MARLYNGVIDAVYVEDAELSPWLQPTGGGNTQPLKKNNPWI